MGGDRPHTTAKGWPHNGPLTKPLCPTLRNGLALCACDLLPSGRPKTRGRAKLELVGCRVHAVWESLHRIRVGGRH